MTIQQDQTPRTASNQPTQITPDTLRHVTFDKTKPFKPGYMEREVDEWLDDAVVRLEAGRLQVEDLMRVRFTVQRGQGYDVNQVDRFLDRLTIQLSRPPRTVVELEGRVALLERRVELLEARLGITATDHDPTYGVPSFTPAHQTGLPDATGRIA